MSLLFMHCLCTVYVLKNIKNGSHDTIYIFKNYFATVFSVFSFQFSVTISSIQTGPISHFGPLKYKSSESVRLGMKSQVEISCFIAFFF